jgi:hypothetical protein
MNELFTTRPDTGNSELGKNGRFWDMTVMSDMRHSLFGEEKGTTAHDKHAQHVNQPVGSCAGWDHPRSSGGTVQRLLQGTWQENPGRKGVLSVCVKQRTKTNVDDNGTIL